MKIAIKNFLTTLKRYRTASVLNIVGLTIAFIAFYILVAQVHHGLMYNSTIPDYERVYVTVAKTSVMQDYYAMGVGRPQTEMTIAQVPEVEAGGVITTGAEQLSIHKLNNGHYDCYDLKSALATPSALEALSLQLIAGDIEQFKIPNKVIISDRAAKQMKIGLGDMVYYGKAYDNNIDFKPVLSCEVVGIYRAFAKNSLFAEMDAVRCCKEDEFNKVYQAKFTGIVKLRPDADTEKFEKLWMENYSKQITKDLGDGAIAPKGAEMHLVSLKNLYFAPYDFTDRGNLNLGEAHNNPTAVYSQLAIAILIVLIAFINFINFFFALIPVRIRAVNISKVFGATNRSLRWSFMFEALALTLISLGLALYLMIAVPDTPIANFVSCSLALRDNVATIGWILLAVVVLALTAALYPAWYITSFSPSLAAKGRFGGSKAGQRLRLVLSVVQFSISMALIIITLAFWLQYRYMSTYDMGFDHENVVTFTNRSAEACKHNTAILEELMRSPMIEDVTMAQGDMFQQIMTMGIAPKGEGKMFSVECIPVRYNFLNFFRIPVDGRDFTPADIEEHIITAELKEKLNASYHRVPRLEAAIGVISGCRFRSLNRQDVYYAMSCENSELMQQFYVRLQPNANDNQVVEYIKNVMRKFGCNADAMDVVKVKDQIADMYAETRNQSVLMSLFSVLSIVISLMGVFGIVIFETQYRRREIAIRRVFGATTSGLIWLFNSRYVQIVGACFLIATPVAYYIIDEWQKDYAYKAPIGVWVYVAAFAIIALLTLALVSYRSYRAANENPAQVVKEN